MTNQRPNGQPSTIRKTGLSFDGDDWRLIYEIIRDYKGPLNDQIFYRLAVIRLKLASLLEEIQNALE